VEGGHWKSETWLGQRLERLNALYQKFGRAGLEQCNDASLLLWQKQLELRDGKHPGEERHLLELEIKDLAGYLKERRPAKKPQQAIERRNSQELGR
jgi:hypothetical protein